MGLSIQGGLKSLLYIKHSHPNLFGGSVLQLGRQDMYFSYDDLCAAADEFSITLKQFNPQFVRNPWTNNIVIDDYTLFSSLGFSIVDSMDYVGNEGATIVHDLNNHCPNEFNERWDMILDSGTIEHIFDLKTAFSNIHSMLKPNGIVAHMIPLNNWIDHGFWQICPTALVDFYGANGYKILKFWIEVYEIGKDLQIDEPSRFLYDSSLFHAVSYLDRFPNGKAGLCFFAQKISQTGDKVIKTPTQGFYQKHWGNMPGVEHNFGEIGGILNIQPIV